MRNVLSRKSGKQKCKVRRGVVHLLTANGKHKSYRTKTFCEVGKLCTFQKGLQGKTEQIYSSPFQLFHRKFAINTQDLIPASHPVKQHKHLDTGSFLPFSVSHLNMIVLSVPVQHKSHHSVCPSWDSSTKILLSVYFQHCNSATKSAQ